MAIKMNVDQKAQEISLALIKISVYARRPEFRRNLERLAFQLLEEVSRRDFGPVFKTTMALEGLIRFGNAIYEIEPINSDILLQELISLNSAIGQVAEVSLPDSKRLPDVELTFREEKKTTKQPKKNPSPESKGNPPRIISKHVTEKRLPAPSSIREKTLSTTKQTNGGDDNPAIRQSTIVEKIRQSGNESIKLKDIVAEFPKYSERTLRYDIQRLCNQGILERVGSGGPATYYKVRDI